MSEFLHEISQCIWRIRFVSFAMVAVVGLIVLIIVYPVTITLEIYLPWYSVCILIFIKCHFRYGLIPMYATIIVSVFLISFNTTSMVYKAIKNIFDFIHLLFRYIKCHELNALFLLVDCSICLMYKQNHLMTLEPV